VRADPYRPQATISRAGAHGRGPVLPPAAVQGGVLLVDGLEDLALDEHLGVVVAQKVEALGEGGVVEPVQPVVGEISGELVPHWTDGGRLPADAGNRA